jgi:DNA-binding transcriptional LysR family regulator
LGSTEAIKGAVIAGFGASLVSRLAIVQELALGRLTVVPSVLDPVTRTRSTVERHAARPAPAVVAFLELLRSAATGA